MASKKRMMEEQLVREGVVSIVFEQVLWYRLESENIHDECVLPVNTVHVSIGESLLRRNRQNYP